MEQASEHNGVSHESVENSNNYEQTVAEGKERAKDAIAAIDNFRQMDYRGQFAALNELMNEYVKEGAHYETEYVAAQMKTIELQQEIAEKDAELQKIRDYYDDKLAEDIMKDQEEVA